MSDEKVHRENRNIKDHHRRILAAKYELRRNLYKALVRDPDIPSDMRAGNLAKLAKLPRNSSFTRTRNKCIFSGRPQGVYEMFRISRIVFRSLASKGMLNGIKKIVFEYAFNNFLHHHVGNIIFSCLESNKPYLVEHLLRECNLVGNILEAEKNYTLAVDSSKPTVPAEGRSPPRIGYIGHLTRVSNKLLQLANNNSDIQAYLQENNEWMDWHTNVLTKRNAVENVYQWTCGKPTALQDRRDSDDDDYQDRDYDVAALSNNLS